MKHTLATSLATYQKAVVHRQAAVRTSRLIRCAPAEPGDSFG